QSKYKEAGKKELVNCLYSLLPETKETQHAKEKTQLYSEKAYREEGKKEAGCCLYAQMPQTIETVFAKELTKTQSDVSLTSTLKFALDFIATQICKRRTGKVAYKSNTKQLTYSDCSLLARTDIQHAKEVSKLASQVKYKESFDRQLKGQKPCYNPLDCLSFRHTQAAAALASQVEYKKKYEQTKAHYHIPLDTAEQLHHKENAVLHSQVKYREEYEKNKGRSQMEFGDTQMYKVSKEAQKIQSEREYRRDYEEQMKGKALVDVDQTPGYLTARHASSLLSEKEYRKDLEQEVKGRGLSGVGLEETPELLRVKKANQILNQKEYRKDLEREIVGKGMELTADVLEIQRAKRASEIQSQVTMTVFMFPLALNCSVLMCGSMTTCRLMN
uniref:Nebulette n=1 Tax=Anabas testudineus TaxID=64144 RepID=A0A3Q1JFV9_ANATE